MIAPAIGSALAIRVSMMADTKSVVILGGTAEARILANQLVDTYGDQLRVITSLAGRTEKPRLPKGEVRQGGFGGVDGLVAYLVETNTDILVDATHPYARQISAHAAAASTETETPFLMFVRPPWEQKDGDSWISVSDVERVAAAVPTETRACLITTGTNDLAKLANIRADKVFVRLIETPKEKLQLENAEIVHGRPPYKKDEERALFHLLGIDCLISKNAGGAGTYAKIEIANERGIPVVMIQRPALPDCEHVSDIEQAIRRIRDQLRLI